MKILFFCIFIYLFSFVNCIQPLELLNNCRKVQKTNRYFYELIFNLQFGTRRSSISMRHVCMQLIFTSLNFQTDFKLISIQNFTRVFFTGILFLARGKGNILVFDHVHDLSFHR